MRIFTALALFASLVVPSTAQTNGAHRISTVIQRGDGVQAQIVPFAQVSVCVAGTASTGCTAATVYSNPALSVPASQPIVADENGNYDYYADPGCYDEVIASPGTSSQVIHNVCSAPGSGGGATFPSTVSIVVATSATTSRPAVLSDIQTVFGPQPGYYVLGNCTTVTGLLTPCKLTLDMISPAFAISAFNCTTAGNYEHGATITSPSTCAASYTSSPSSATLTDGTHTVALSAPFTIGSLPYQYTCTNGFSFTLTAVGATTQAASQEVGCYMRVFTGAGTPGATGATPTGTNQAALANATGTLNSFRLGDLSVGDQFTLTPQNQVMYVIAGCGHTFSVNGLPTALSSIAFTYTNQFNYPEADCLYYTAGSFTGTYLYQVTQ